MRDFVSTGDKRYLLALEPKEITKELFIDLFGNDVESEKSKFETNDKVSLTIDEVERKFGVTKIVGNGEDNTTSISTTVGRMIFNIYLDMSDVFGYMNKTMDKGNIKGMNSVLTSRLLERTIDISRAFEFIDKMDWLGYSVNRIITSSLTYNLLQPLPEVEKRKEELFEKYAKEIENKDMAVVSKIEGELLDLAKKLIKDKGIPDFDIYESGARGSFENNYKNTTIMRGIIKDPSDIENFFVSKSSLMDGIPKDEFHNYANLIVAASYSRAVGTRSGGYEAKKLNASFQTVTIGEEESDCLTKKTIKVLLTNKSRGQYMYRNIIYRNKLVQLNEENMDKFIGKVVDMRTPLYCTDKVICSVCAGDLFYRIGIKNVGLLANRVGTKLLNLALKDFHDVSISMSHINISDYITRE